MSFADTFFNVYPEFTNKITSEQVEALKLRVCTIYTFLENVSDIIVCMAVAHFIIYDNYVSIDSNTSMGTNGTITSATVGSVSIGKESMPINSSFDYVFGSTKYGQELLAWLSTQGMLYVN